MMYMKAKVRMIRPKFYEYANVHLQNTSLILIVVLWYMCENFNHLLSGIRSIVEKSKFEELPI